MCCYYLLYASLFYVEGPVLLALLPLRVRERLLKYDVAFLPLLSLLLLLLLLCVL